METQITKPLEILVVEDEHIDTARKYFDSVNGISADYAETSSEALSKFAEKEYSGLITDSSFPQNKGEDTQREGEKTKYEAMIRGMPWVQISGHGQNTLFTFPLRKINAKEVEKAGSCKEWDAKYEIRGENTSLADDCETIEQLKEPTKFMCQYGVEELYKSKEESWERAFKIFKRVKNMYENGGDLVDYFSTKLDKDWLERREFISLIPNKNFLCYWDNWTPE